MFERIKNRKPEYIAAAVIMIYALFLLARIVMATVQTAAYPNEYREAANIAMTEAVKKGKNIYTLEGNMGETPAVCYLYGPLMSVLAAFLSVLIPIVPLQVIHYGISIVSIIISALLMALMVREHIATPIAPWAAAVLTVFCHWRYGYGYGAPDSFGLCLMTGALYFLHLGATRRGGSYKGFDASIEISALLTLACFFTKQYYLMVAAVGAVYLLFVSGRLFIRYAASGVVFSVITFSLLYKFCPLYLTYAIYFLKGPGPGAAMGKTGRAHNTLQISYLGGIFIMLFLAVLALGIYLAVSLFKMTGKSGFTKAGLASVREKKDFPFVLLFSVHGLIAFIVLRYIGNNDGAFLSYYLQLFTPALTALSVYALELLALPGRLRGRGMIAVIALYIIFMGYTIYRAEPRLVINMLSEQEMGEWKRSYEILDSYHQRGEIYYGCPLLNYYGYEKGDYIYNDGQPFVFTEKFLKSFNESEAAKKLFPDAGEIIAKHIDFRDGLRQKVLDGDYSLVAYLPDVDVVFSEDDLKQNYSYLDTLSLRAGSWTWDVQLWEKKAAGN